MNVRSWIWSLLNLLNAKAVFCIDFEMPRPERPPRPQRTAGAQGINVFAQIESDIKALNSSVLLLSQKMQYLVRNEKILGRNLIVLSKRLKEIEAGGISTVGSAAVPENLSVQLAEFASKLDSHGQKILEMQNEIAGFKDQFALREELKEVKYVIDAINPLEFVTQKQLNEWNEKTRKKK